MALFKIFRGPENELNNVPCHNGYAYFTEDYGNLYIDIGDNEGDRVQVNAHYADALIKRSQETGEIISEIDIDDLVLKDATIAVNRGGTGRQTLTVNALLIGDGENAVKMVPITDGQVVVGDTTSGVRAVGGTGILYSLTANAPQFGIAPISVGGTGGTTQAEARTNLDVYSKGEVDTNVGAATTLAYTTTLLTNGWSSNGDKFTYSYINTNLSCGKNHNVPPIVTYTSNLDEYSKIESAEATASSGIVFTISEKPKNNIGLIIVDVK